MTQALTTSSVDWQAVTPPEPSRGGAKRRRLAFLLSTALLAAGISACSGPTDVAKDSTTSTGPPASSSTTTTRPTRPARYHVGIVTFDWVDHSRTTLNPADPDGPPIPGRKLTTEIRYPTLRGKASEETEDARPATADGPFPVIFFAHGYDLEPSYYEQLLDAWVRDGFVVVSPIFPDENTATVVSVGGPYSQDGMNAEDDLPNEPVDVAYVMARFARLDARDSGSLLAGIGNLDKTALAGQSDGGDAVAALAYGSAYAATWASLAHKPKAVAVLSGQALDEGPGGVADTERATRASPDLLQVQSAADTCNGAQDAADLFSELEGAPLHLFETLTGASHLAPYTGVPPYAAVVERVTTDFFELELGWRSRGLSVRSVESAGSVDGVSSVAPTVTAFTGSPPGGDCPGLPTTPPPGGASGADAG